MRLFWHLFLATGIILASSLCGCASSKTLNLMPTPVIYQDSQVDPFAHLSPEHRSPQTHVFYATNRAPIYPGSTDFGNELDSVVHLGTATIRMGTPDIDWDDLYKSSLADNAPPLPLSLDKVNEMALLPALDTPVDHILTPELQAFADAINAELAIAVDKEIMVYVHGTKVDFTNATILTAEIDHFAGRDFVGLAYAWPSHQNILAYLTGADVSRALNSSRHLKIYLWIKRYEALQQGAFIPSAVEYEAYTKDGSTIWTLLTAKYTENVDGTVIGARVVAIDITDKKVAQEEAERKEEIIFNELETRLKEWKDDMTTKDVVETQLQQIDLNIMSMTGKVEGL